MKMKRRTLIQAALAMTLTTTLGTAAAQSTASWPTKPVTLIVPYSPGGGTDIIARLVGAKLSELWGQSVVVENKAGANGVIGSVDVQRAAPDGYKIMLVVGSHVINPVLTKSVPFDPVADFTPITRLATSPLVLVVQNNDKYPDLASFIEQGRKSDVSIGYSEGQTQLTGELIRQAAGVKTVPVPYKGGSPLMVDIIGGHVESGVTSVLTALPHVHSGKLKVIGVADKAPNAAFPGVATFHDAGYPAVESLSWYGLFGPKGMSQEIVERIRTDLKRVTEDPTVAKQLKDQGATILIDSSDDFRKFLADEKTKWAEVAKKGGIEAQ